MPRPKAASRDRFSISKKLKEENKINDVFEIILSSLTFEEIIALKFELTARAVGSAIYGLPLWSSVEYMVKDALIKYALAVSPSKTRAKHMLGMTGKSFYKYLTIYGIRDYFDDPKGESVNESDN